MSLRVKERPDLWFGGAPFQLLEFLVRLLSLQRKNRTWVGPGGCGWRGLYAASGNREVSSSEVGRKISRHLLHCHERERSSSLSDGFRRYAGLLDEFLVLDDLATTATELLHGLLLNWGNSHCDNNKTYLKRKNTRQDKSPFRGFCCGGKQGCIPLSLLVSIALLDLEKSR